MSIPLEKAQLLVAGSLAKAAKLGLRPLSVAVLDGGGHLLAFARQDGASTLRPQIAMGKAGGALALGISSRQIGAMAAERASFVGSLGPIAPYGVIPAAGGVIVVAADGRTIGAVGVSGDSPHNDEVCALAGIAAAGLAIQS